jgi:hypothetical protein
VSSLLKPKAAKTPIPEFANFETQIDTVAGTKVERVKQPDGTYALVQSTLPMSPEDQAMQDAWTRIAQSSLDYIDKLANSYDRADIPWLDEYLTSYETGQRDVINRAGLARTTAEEKALARFGQADSTAAAQARSQRYSDTVDQEVQLGRELVGIEQDARAQAMSQQAGLYDIATGGLNNQKSIQLGSLSNLVNSGLTQQQNRQGYNNTVAATVGANNQAKAAANQSFMNNLTGVASLVAAPFTGGASLYAGGLLSSITGGSASAKDGTSGGWANYGSGLSNQIKWNSGRMA